MNRNVFYIVFNKNKNYEPMWNRVCFICLIICALINRNVRFLDQILIGLFKKNKYCLFFMFALHILVGIYSPKLLLKIN